MNADKATITKRLEYLRGEIHAQRISYFELDELQSLAEHIDPGDVELLEWAGVPEFPDAEQEERTLPAPTAIDLSSIPANARVVIGECVNEAWRVWDQFTFEDEDDEPPSMAEFAGWIAAHIIEAFKE